MNKLEETFLRLCLKPGIECNLPGRLRLSFGKYRLLPKEAAPYLHYIRDVLRLLPGVSDAEINPRIGTVLIRYDTEITSSRAILKWVDIVVEDLWKDADESELEALVRKRLILRLPQQKEG